MDSSKNEILIAIMLGILLGFVAVLTFYFVSKKNLLKNAPQSTILKLDEKTAKNKSIVENFDLTLTPKDADLISEVQKFVLKGKTSKNALVIIQSDTETFKIKPDSNGNFEKTINLENEVNQIFATAILGNTQEKTIEKTVIYSPK